MARTIRLDNKDYYRYVSIGALWGRGPYDSMEWPRRYLSKYGSGRIQKLEAVENDGVATLEWVNVE